jgi:putative membrane protein insertion efficiency factor
MKRIAVALMLGMIWCYQVVISPFMRPHCRFTPSCSAYARTAILRHGACSGGWLALKRLARCHPWGGHGYDPVP